MQILSKKSGENLCICIFYSIFARRIVNEYEYGHINTDGTGLKPEIIAKYMNYDHVRYCVEMREILGKRNFYCGITNDMDANYSRHKNDEFGGEDFEYVSVYKCASAEDAASVEPILQQEGYDCGNATTMGNGGTDDSISVYMFRKP